MINCAHPTHFEQALAKNEAWIKRVRGVRANASTRSHAELDAAPDLDDGNPVELGQQYRALRAEFPSVQRAGRLLRHRPPARRADLLRLQRRRRGGSGGLALPGLGCPLYPK